MSERYFVEIVDDTTGRKLVGEDVLVDTDVQNGVRVTTIDTRELTGNLSLESALVNHHFVTMRLTRNGRTLITTGHVPRVQNGIAEIHGQAGQFA